MGEFSDKVFDIVRQVPYGKVTTYGQVAALMGRPQSGRYVGFALRNNPTPVADGGDIPCHRVLFKDGSLCKGFAFGGPEVQREMLETEGVTFVDNDHVDLEAHQWDGRGAGSVPDGPPDDFDWEAELGSSMLTIGPHISIAKGFAAAARDAASIGANTFQFFTRNPRGGKAKALDPADLQAFAGVRAESGIERILAHAPYTLNPCSAKPETREFALQTLADDLVRMDEIMPGQLYNMHPGAHVGQGAEVAIPMIADALNQVLAPEQTTTLLLETMAGKGSEVGRTFEELAAIIDRVELDDHVGVCLDTCHIWDGGYDIAADLDGVLAEFDRVIGLNRLRAIHLNDSKNPRGAHKDRHAALGDGHIGFDALAAVTRHPLLRDLPFYLETPHDDLSGYADEISRLRAQI